MKWIEKIKVWWEQRICDHDWITVVQGGKNKFRCRKCNKEIV